MPRPYRPLSPPGGSADPWADFLSCDPPELPPQPRAAAAPPEKPADSVVALGPPPADSMAAAKWAYTMCMRLAHETFNNQSLSSKDREARVLKILSGAAKHMTDAMRFDVSEMIRKDREDLDRRRRYQAAAETEARPPAPEGARVIPIRRDA